MSGNSFSIVSISNYSVAGWTSSDGDKGKGSIQKDNKGKKPDAKEVKCDQTKRIKRNLTNQWVKIKQIKVGDKCYWEQPYWCVPRCTFQWDRKKGVCRPLPCDIKCCSEKEKKQLEKIHKIKVDRKIK